MRASGSGCGMKPTNLNPLTSKSRCICYDARTELQYRITINSEVPSIFRPPSGDVMQRIFSEFADSSSGRDIEWEIDSQVSNVGEFDYKRLQCTQSWQPSFRYG